MDQHNAGNSRETAWLLNGANETYHTLNNQESTPTPHNNENGNNNASSLDQIANRQKSVLMKYAEIWIGFLVGFLVICFTVFACREIARETPSNEAIQRSIIEMTDWNITEIKINGWSDPFSKNTAIVYNRFNLVKSKNKYLQFDVKLNTAVHYDNIQNDTLTLKQQKRFRTISESLMKKVCIDIKNVTTWDLDQNNTNLGSLVSGSPICVSLKDGEINNLILHLYFKPNVQNYWKIIKKIWNHQYDDIHLQSDLNLAVKMFVFHLETKFWNLNKLTIDWHDLIDHYNWDNDLNFFRNNWPPNIELLDLQMVDTKDGFNLQLKLMQITNFIKLWAKKRLPYLDLSNLNTVLPSMLWDIKLPDCNDNYSIQLTNANSSSKELEVWNHTNWEPIVDIDLNGPLPNDLINKVCDSDDINIITPLTKILNDLLNETEFITFQMKGKINSDNEKIVNSAEFETKSLDNKLFNEELTNNLLNEISYFPIQPNVTFNISQLIKEVDIMDMKFQRNGNRLSVIGTVQGIINLSFYETNDERFFVNNIKANLELYHKGTHFISLPMKVWTNSTSKIIHEDQSGMTQLQIQFDVDDKDMEITNHFELTKVINEILFTGETLISFESITDIIIDSLLGEIIINGLKTNGETVVH